MCDFNYTLTHYPLICSGSNTHRVILDFTTISPGTNVKIYFSPVVPGLAPCYSANPDPFGNWQWTWDMYGTFNTNYTLHVEHWGGPVCSGGLICALSTITFPVHDYNADPFTILNGGIIPAGCVTGGSVTAIIFGGIPANGYYFELWNSSNTVLLQNPPVQFTNSHTFSGLAAGSYTIRCYRQYPPGHPNVGLQSPCYVSQLVTITTECRLKATDCNNPLITVVFDGSSIISSIGLVIYAAFGVYTARCWKITQTTDPINATLGGYTGPFSDCVSCTPCSDIISTITGVDDRCDSGTGSATVTPVNGTSPYSYLWSPTGQTTQTATGLYGGTHSVIITDSQGCTGTNSIVINTLPCDKHYIITPCDTAVQPFYVTNPVTTPNSNSNAYIGNIFDGIITTPSGIISGCFNMMPAALPGLTGVTIDVVFYSYQSCFECNPVAWKITRCDDSNVFYITNSDLSSIAGKVIKNIIISGCTEDTFPCATTPQQCWSVAQAAPVITPVILVSYQEIHPDCPCCKPCE